MFDPVSTIIGIAAPLNIANVDTDVIIRIERLTIGDPREIGRYAFEALRYLADGQEDPHFILNRPAYRGASILLAGPNFGCGSSREPAVTALMAMGLRVIVAQSFGDIFYANCFQNGLLPIRLDEAAVQALMESAGANPRPFTVDLNEKSIAAPDGRVFDFTIDAQRREALLAGVDDIGLTLRDTAAIHAWQAADRTERVWIWQTGDAA